MFKGVELRVENVSKTFRDYEETVALKNVSLRVEKGELFSILGPSGCGKTTLLRIIAGLLSPDEGRILIDGKDITDKPAYERPIGMVFQDLALFPHMTVYKNIAFSLELRGEPEDKIEEKVKEVMELVRLPYREFAHRKITQLSGGQQQRVAIARAIAKEPSILLLDEPFSHLDYKIRLELIQELKRMQRETGITTVYVTHDQNEAMMLSDRMAIMRDGKVVQVGDPVKLYMNPADTFVASFLGEANLIPVEVRDGVFEILGKKVDLGQFHPSYRGFSGRVYVFIRPEEISLSPPQEGSYISLNVEVREKIFLGPLTKLVLNGFGNKHLEVLSPSNMAHSIKAGSRVDVYIDTRRIKVFSA